MSVTELRSRTHECPWPGCKEQVGHSVWGCNRHWYGLPQHLRMAITAGYRKGMHTPEHLCALRGRGLAARAHRAARAAACRLSRMKDGKLEVATFCDVCLRNHPPESDVHELHGHWLGMQDEGYDGLCPVFERESPAHRRDLAFVFCPLCGAKL